MKQMLRSKCNAYSAYRLEEHTHSLDKKKKCFDLKNEKKKQKKTGIVIKYH